MTSRVPSLSRFPAKRQLLATLFVFASVVAAPEVAPASEKVTDNASNVTLKVDNAGHAVVSWTRAGVRRNAAVWGASNARNPHRSVPQVKFKIDYSGGYQKLGYPLWKTIRNRCRPYDGPQLAWFVKACKAPDGSYWALQRWQRRLPNLGLTPWKREQRTWELHVSHWSGELPRLEIYLDWIYSSRFHHLFGRFTYRGQPVHGFVATPAGAPLDTYGRNVYVDTYNSAYGPGWKRENGFLTHRAGGNFCYGFYPRERYATYPVGPRRPMGHGERYRVTVMGPGVTPVIGWAGAGRPDYDAANPEHVAHEQQMNALGDVLAAPDTKCKQH